MTSLSGVTGIFRYFLIAQFNISFLNPQFYGNCKTPNLMHSMFEDNRAATKGQIIVEDILRFMFSTELHALSGLSFLDIMELDSYTYSLVKKIYEEVEKPKREAISKLQQDMSKQQLQHTTNFSRSNLNKERVNNERKHLRSRK